MPSQTERENAVALRDRTEVRFILPSAESFLRSLPSFREVTFSPNTVVQTVYFNSDEHVVPFGTSFKARRYLPTRGVLPRPTDDFVTEVKRSVGARVTKERNSRTLAEAAAFFNGASAHPVPPLRAYTCTEYVRRHFVAPDEAEIRITVDNDVRYLFFEANTAEPADLGREVDYVRVEVKIGAAAHEAASRLLASLLSMGAFPVTSKKYASYTFLKRRRERLYGRASFFQEVGDLELEAKLIASPDEGAGLLSSRLKSFFRGGQAAPYRLAREYPYTHETASVNRYYDSGGSRFKAIAKGDKARIISKSAPEVCPDALGLGCIVRREETKGEPVLVWDSRIRNGMLAGELYRKRRAFWVENVSSRRIFHICLDECRSGSHYLYQVEIEYTGGYEQPVNAGEDAVVSELAAIAQALLSEFPCLTATSLTKEQWLAGLR